MIRKEAGTTKFFVNDGIIKAVSRFDRFRQPASRRREEIVKAGLLDGLRGLGSIPGKRQAEAVLTLSDAGCETIGEQALLFALATVMPYEIHTQHEVREIGRVLWQFRNHERTVE